MSAHFPRGPHFVPGRRLSIAVIGSGVSGSAAAWALHPVHDVTLYEKDNRPGGHTATVDIDYDGTPISVDTGFIVYNEANYPNLTALLAELDVTTHRSDMSFSVSLDHGRLEWSGDNLATVFAQKRNLVRPSFLLMLREILRFNRICLEDRTAGRLQAMSIGDYLNWRGFSPGFTNNYLVPMAAAIWSSPAAKMLEFPAEHFIQFFDNHRLIYTKPHPWRTVTGGSRNYLRKLLVPLGQRLRLGCGVRSIRRQDDKVLIVDEHGVTGIFDKVIVAAHSDQTLEMLFDATPLEKSLLTSVPYHPNRVILHRDVSLMPKRQKCWASWNYLRSAKPCGAHSVAVSYWMNRLQGIPSKNPLFVTLNPEREPAPGTVFAEFSYDHPQFDAASMAAQCRLKSIQGDNNTFFVGAWTGYGFHEDGLASGLAAAETLGGIVPWRRQISSPFREAAE
ncbi:FAD-dependent oxidoreductase [Pararhizobium sp. BT-229]|uniref:NAD(P)/FAD-dependent oxidoreductase n=1 Tax=Pararhizobium sp. BT-229 TaxID=2986923 RepID=UPI0021F79F29|nr:FAD-dependent oxidoreductase [Pararhizobium sp. BT-229]MCV9960424.1 FAD-dependent oxidoreductase [Pararhizobium sp. BT-229]